MAASLHRSPAPVLGQFLLAALMAAMIGAVVVLPRSRAAFVDTTSAVGNTAVAAACFYSPTVQSGTTTNSANGTQTVSISSVDPTRAFLLFSTRHNSNQPRGSFIGGEIASATTVEFNRNTSESTPADIDIRWYVVEYSCGVQVQRGTIDQTSTTVNATITPVAALSQAFVTYSKTVASSDSTWGTNDAVMVDLTSTTNVEARAEVADSAHTIYWQVVEFTDAAMISVQRGNTSIPNGSSGVTVTLPTAVDTSKAFPLVSSRVDDGLLDELLLRTRLLSSTSLEIARAFTDNDINEISWQVVELLDGSSVQHFHTLLSPGTASSTVTVSSVDLTRATAFAGTQNGGGQNGGRTTYFSDDIIGVASATFSFSSATQVSIARSSTVDFGSMGWQVVEWGN